MPKSGTKKCPYCSVFMKVDATECFSCKRKVGPPNEQGIAKKPINWKANIIAVITLSGFIYYLWWIWDNLIKGDK